MKNLFSEKKIVAGFYLSSVQTENILGKSIEELCDVMIQDLTGGCPEMSDVKCGFIGEVASDYPADCKSERNEINDNYLICKGF